MFLRQQQIQVHKIGTCRLAIGKSPRSFLVLKLSILLGHSDVILSLQKANQFLPWVLLFYVQGSLQVQNRATCGCHHAFGGWMKVRVFPKVHCHQTQRCSVLLVHLGVWLEGDASTFFHVFTLQCIWEQGSPNPFIFDVVLVTCGEHDARSCQLGQNLSDLGMSRINFRQWSFNQKFWRHGRIPWEYHPKSGAKASLCSWGFYPSNHLHIHGSVPLTPIGLKWGAVDHRSPISPTYFAFKSVQHRENNFFKDHVWDKLVQKSWDQIFLWLFF